MGALSTLNRPAIDRIGTELRTTLGESQSVDEAAQALTEALFAEFGDSSVLIRLYVTIPFGDLPPFNRNFVSALASDNGVSERLHEGTPILSLMGSSGREAAWCDRRQSKGHVGIPLVSSDFVDAIPMVSRLLKQMGLGIDWLDTDDLGRIGESSTEVEGFFYVPSASDETDAQGRKVIPAQDFVDAYGVRTVFGVGGRHDESIAVAIVFANETIEKATAEQLQPLINSFIDVTVPFTHSKDYFAD